MVGSNFCAPHAVHLTVAKEFSLSDGDFTIKDANGNMVFRVMGDFLSFQDHCVLVDAGDTPLLIMQQKMFSAHRRWEMFRGQTTEAEDLVFSVKISNLLQLKAELDVIMAGNPNEEACDFKIKGSFFESSCTSTIYREISIPS